MGIRDGACWGGRACAAGGGVCAGVRRRSWHKGQRLGPMNRFTGWPGGKGVTRACWNDAISTRSQGGGGTGPSSESFAKKKSLNTTAEGSQDPPKACLQQYQTRKKYEAQNSSVITLYLWVLTSTDHIEEYTASIPKNLSSHRHPPFCVSWPQMDAPFSHRGFPT